MPSRIPSHDPFTPADRRTLERRGIPVQEAREQLARLESPPGPIALARPCTLDDGIVSPDAAAQARALQAHAAAAASGHVSQFLPASGAATRMFQDLTSLLQGTLRDMRPHQHEFFANLADLPFSSALREALLSRGTPLDELVERRQFLPILDALLGPQGLALGALPKGLIPFHQGPAGAVTAFEEHLIEAAVVAADATGRFRLHATVSLEHRERFVRHLDWVRTGGRLPEGLVAEVEFSSQDPATDTLALDETGRPARAADGTLLFRPSGHGALLPNLSRHAASAGEAGRFVLIKNIDNVAPAPLKEPTLHWSRVLLGMAAELTAEIHALLDALASGGPTGEAERFVRTRLGETGPLLPPGSGSEEAARAALLRRLDRPLRICGMVRNEGEPGGGPFWVRGDGPGESRQIVESAQVSPASEEQKRIFGSSTHFNPVYLACSLHNRHGRPHDLARFADPSAVIVTRKSHEGRPITALERPGLWNGAMAGWITLFVEVPIEVFNPVKTVHDLLRPAHRAGAGGR